VDNVNVLPSEKLIVVGPRLTADGAGELPGLGVVMVGRCRQFRRGKLRECLASPKAGYQWPKPTTPTLYMCPIALSFRASVSHL
jgi:hypothetical protein